MDGMARKILVTLCCAALAACTQSGALKNGEHAYTKPAALRVEIAQIPKNLNPIYVETTNDSFLGRLAFDALVTADPHGNDVPDLAQVVPTLANGGISANGKTVTYHLRRGVKWQDGAPFSSADVKFSWQAVMNPRNNVIERRGYDEVASVETPDANTVVFHLKEPFSPFVDTVFADSDEPYGIIPAHLLAKYPDLNQVPFNSQPIGTGPFKVTRFIAGDKVEYAANDAYFRGKPHLRSIVVSFVTDDNTRLTDLRSHAADLAIQVTPDVIRQARGVRDLRTLLVPAPYFDALAMNMAHPPLGDLRVRKAIAYALDREALIRNETYGTGTLASADLSKYYWAYDPNVAGYPFDLKRAAALLDEAGWKMGADGIRSQDGKRFELWLAFDRANPTFRKMAVEIQSQLRAVGIDVHAKGYETTMMYASVSAGGIFPGGKYDIGLSPWIAGADPDDSQQWMCAYQPPNGYDITHFCNAEFDAAERIALSHTDRPTRLAAYSKTQRMLVEQLPMAFLYYQPLMYVMNPDLKNFNPNGIVEGWNAAEWSI